MDKYIILSLILPFIGALGIKTLFKKKPVETSLLFTLLQFISLIFVWNSLKNSDVISFKCGINFFCDSLSFIFAITSVLVGIFIFLYSINYFSDESIEQKNVFSFWSLIFLGSMIGVLFSDNLISMYLFWELAALCSWRLIGFYRKDEDLVKADKAFMITSGGAGIMLLSIGMIYIRTGTLNLSGMTGISVSPIIFFLFFIGVITKSATFPFHKWLPDAGIAPTPVTSFLHAAVLVKIGIYGLARLFGLTLSISGSIFWAGWLALFSSFLAGILALCEKDIKKVLAYSTISQLGFMIAGLLVFQKTAFWGVITFYVAHAIGKGGLFMCAGILEKIFGTKDIRKMGSGMKLAPYTSFAFLFCFLSVSGAPPLLGFWGKLNIIYGILKSGRNGFAFFAILTSILTLFYLLRLFKYIFMRDIQQPITVKKEKGLKLMVISVVFLAVISLLFGFCFPFITGGLIE
ncbi:NADH-quinone oxidoreductase subunit L [bacterium]|nr:NADH-quinone oxidoreductase subunit L [bacterium]